MQEELRGRVGFLNGRGGCSPILDDMPTMLRYSAQIFPCSSEQGYLNLATCRQFVWCS
jgi:hypothetical protein